MANKDCQGTAPAGFGKDAFLIAPVVTRLFNIDFPLLGQGLSVRMMIAVSYCSYALRGKNVHSKVYGLPNPFAGTRSLALRAACIRIVAWIIVF